MASRARAPQKAQPAIEALPMEELGRLQLEPYLLAFCLFLYRRNEVFRDLIVNVCFEQRQTNLAERRRNVFPGQDAFAAQVFQRPL